MVPLIVHVPWLEETSTGSHRWIAKRQHIGWTLSALSDGWVVFDMCIVTVGVVTKVVAVAMDQDEIGNTSGLRLLRLLRLLRAVRLVEHFQTLYLLVQGLIMSLPITFWTLILVLLCVFIFAMLCAELVVRPVRTSPQDYPEEYIKLIDEHFGSLEESMLTFVSFITMDNIASIYKP